MKSLIKNKNDLTFIYHITSWQKWIEALEIGVYRGDTLESEGFIHCSNDGQVSGTGEKYFANKSGLVLLRIIVEKVDKPIRYEGMAGGVKFPHIYGELNTGAVKDWANFQKSGDSSYPHPETLNFSLERMQA